MGLLAYRLGSVHPDSGKSFTQLEYEQALNLRRDILIYMADDRTAVFPHYFTDTDASRVEKLRAFKSTLRERHTVSSISTPEDRSSKIESDFRQYFDERASDDRLSENEVTSALATVERFLLMPKSAKGREIRVRVAFEGNPFAASRGICEAFNLEYGRTIGVRVRLDQPSGSETSKFKQLYATRQQADALLALIGSGGDHDVYARLLFGEKDILRIIAEFFGYNAYPYDDYDRGEEIWIPPEGHVILLFRRCPKRRRWGPRPVAPPLRLELRLAARAAGVAPSTPSAGPGRVSR